MTDHLPTPISNDPEQRRRMFYSRGESIIRIPSGTRNSISQAEYTYSYSSFWQKTELATYI